MNDLNTKCLIPSLLLLAVFQASAAISATGDDFGTNTSANYSAANGYAIDYLDNPYRDADFGDGVDGQLGITVASSTATGTLASSSLGTIELSDVGKQIEITMKLDGISANYHNADLVFLVDGSAVGESVSTTNFILYNEAGTAPIDGTSILGDMRSGNGVGTLTYIITSEDVGGSLSWQLAATKTSPGGHTYGIDNWALTTSTASVPEPTSTAFLAISGLALMAHRKRSR